MKLTNKNDVAFFCCLFIHCFNKQLYFLLSCASVNGGPAPARTGWITALVVFFFFFGGGGGGSNSIGSESIWGLIVAPHPEQQTLDTTRGRRLQRSSSGAAASHHSHSESSQSAAGLHHQHQPHHQHQLPFKQSKAGKRTTNMLTGFVSSFTASSVGGFWAPVQSPWHQTKQFPSGWSWNSAPRTSSLSSSSRLMMLQWNVGITISGIAAPEFGRT